MSRIIDAGYATSSKEDSIVLAVLVDLDFGSGFLYLNTSAQTIPYNGINYLGAGQLASISKVEEKSEVESTSIELSLSGVPTEMIALALAEEYQGREVRIYLAILNSDYKIINTPLTIFVGKMDYMQILLGSTATISLVCNSILSDWSRPNVRRYNNEDQQIEYPNDKGLEFVQQAVEKEIVWGQTDFR